MKGLTFTDAWTPNRGNATGDEANNGTAIAPRRLHGRMFRRATDTTENNVTTDYNGAAQNSAGTQYNGVNQNDGVTESADNVAPKNGSTASNTIHIATLMAGQQWGETYAAANAHGVDIIGGADPTVGLGLLMGGGHGPLTAKYGLAADQALEFEVVTWDGQLLIANCEQNTDLFWALRGGGGASFGVVTSVTVKTYPVVTITTFGFLINSTDNNALWDAVTYMSSKAPQLSEAGLGGYLYVNPSADGKQMGNFSGMLIGYDTTKEGLNKTLDPLMAGMNNGAWSNKTTPFGGPFAKFAQYDNLSGWLKGPDPHLEKVGFDGRLGSRLLDEQSLTADVPALRAALETTVAPGQFIVLHLTAGKGVREVKPAGGPNAVLPAWRYTYLHVGKSPPLARL